MSWDYAICRAISTLLCSSLLYIPTPQLHARSSLHHHETPSLHVIAKYPRIKRCLLPRNDPVQIGSKASCRRPSIALAAQGRPPPQPIIEYRVPSLQLGYHQPFREHPIQLPKDLPFRDSPIRFLPTCHRKDAQQTLRGEQSPRSTILRVSILNSRKSRVPTCVSRLRIRTAQSIGVITN